MAAKPKNPVGRPSSYRPEFCDAVMNAEPIRAAGATNQSIAAHLGISIMTVDRWRDEYPEFKAACAEAKRIADDRVEQALFARATGYDNTKAVKIFMPTGAAAPVYAPFTEHYPPDVGAAFNWLKNRKPHEWRDRVEHTGADGGPLEISWQMPAAAPLPGDTARDVTPAPVVLDAAPEPALGDGGHVAVEWGGAGGGSSDAKSVSSGNAGASGAKPNPKRGEKP